jgi:hypothetical protein
VVRGRGSNSWRAPRLEAWRLEACPEPAPRLAAPGPVHASRPVRTISNGIRSKRLRFLPRGNTSSPQSWCDGGVQRRGHRRRRGPSCLRPDQACPVAPRFLRQSQTLRRRRYRKTPRDLAPSPDPPTSTSQAFDLQRDQAVSQEGERCGRRPQSLPEQSFRVAPPMDPRAASARLSSPPQSRPSSTAHRWEARRTWPETTGPLQEPFRPETTTTVGKRSIVRVREGICWPAR